MAEEPRRLFKTISLEERLKASEYNQLPNALPKSNPPQGSPQIRESRLPDNKNTQSPEVNRIPLSQDPQGSPEVQGTPTSQNKDSEEINLPKSQLTLPKEGIVLKSAIAIDDKQAIILKTLVDSPQAQIPPPQTFDTTPLLNSSRPVGRTQFASKINLEDRLAQSNITNTTHLPQYFLTDLYTGYLTISPFSTLAIEDSQNIGQVPLSIGANVILEGLINFIDLTIPNLSEPSSENQTLLSQGTFVENNTFKSVAQTQEPLSENTILVAQGTFISNNIANSFSEVVDAIPTVEINQGSIDLPIFDVAVVQGISPDIPTPPSENTIASFQGLVIENSQIQGSAITLDLLAYEADRALAFGSPRIKHGTTVLVLSEFLASKEKSVNTPLAFHGTTEISFEPFVPALENSPVVELAVQQFLENRTLAINNPIALHGAVVPNLLEFNPNDKPAQSPAINTAPPTPNPALIPPEYSAIVGLGNSYNQGRPTGDSALENTAPNVQARVSPAADPRKDIDDPSSDTDLLTITITPEGGSPIKVKAYLTAFSDGITANWNDISYIGRQDTLKQFTGATRAVSFAVLMPSFTSADITNNLNKLEKIISATVVGSFNPGAVYLTAPLARLRIGGLINSYVAFSSVKWDFDPAEATFDIDRGLPHLLKVSFDCAVLSTSKDRLLNGAEGNYFA